MNLIPSQRIDFLRRGLFIVALFADVFCLGSVEVVHEFPRPGVVGGLVQATDGTFYGLTNGGLFGTAFHLAIDGTVNTFHYFTEADSVVPGSLVLGRDGKLYGFGAGNSVNAPFLFRLGLDGMVDVVHQFPVGSQSRGFLVHPDGVVFGFVAASTSASSADFFKIAGDGSFSTLANVDATTTTGLLKGQDGNFYFLSYLRSLGPIIKSVTPSGGVSTIKVLGFAARVTSFKAADDGNIYGAFEELTETHDVYIFKVAPPGTYTVLAQLATHNAFVAGLTKIADSLYFTQSINFKRITLDGVVSTIASYGYPQVNPSLQFFGSDGKFYGLAADFDGPCLISTTTDGVVSIVTHDFSGEGSHPFGGLATGLDGKLYGTTPEGGAFARGTVYRFDPINHSIETIHSFSPSEGSAPQGRLARDAQGNFYGTTRSIAGGSGETVFKVTPAGEATTLHAFPSSIAFAGLS